MIPESYGIERVDISALTAFSGNPRTHSNTQIDQIAASIREFGWTNPILVDADGIIIAGHGRLAAATKLGLEQVPVNIVVGYGLAVVTQVLVFPLFGLTASFSENLAIGGVFTGISLVRSYLLRRIFNVVGTLDRVTSNSR